jgi:hypothetical protein
MTEDKQLIATLADDVWAIAKKLTESKETTEESKALKLISSCLHDIRADGKTKWYYNMRKEAPK